MKRRLIRRTARRLRVRHGGSRLKRTAPRISSQPPVRCTLAFEITATRTCLPRAQPQSYAGGVTLLFFFVNGERRVVHPNEVLGLLQIARAVHGAGRSAAGVCCATASAIAGGGGPGATDGAIFSFVVPDRVATVTLWGASSHRKAVTITTRPVGNVVVVSVPRSLRNARHQKQILRSANGTVIKTITR
jgi:hypothetical protein